MKTTTALDVSVEPVLGVGNHETEFVPVVRSGAWADIGLRPTMEDVFLCVDDFMSDYGLKNLIDEPSAFYGVFSFQLLLLVCTDLYGCGSDVW